MKVEVIRSHRRRKTVQAREVAGVLRISIPATMSKAEEDEWVSEMVARMQRRSDASHVDLEERARLLSSRYGLREPDSIRWVDNQQWRWGSCTPSQGSIRISSRLAKEPAWVVDYVVVHELAHLSFADHGPRFRSLVDRYPLAERARGFLMARDIEYASGDAAADEDHCEEDPPVPMGQIGLFGRDELAG